MVSTPRSERSAPAPDRSAPPSAASQEPPPIGARVEWESTTTGWHHTGRVVISDNGIGKALVRPDGRCYEWTAWEPIENVRLLTEDPSDD